MRNSNILLSVALIASSAKASLRHQGFVHPSEAPFGPLQTDFSRVNSCSSPRLDCVPVPTQSHDRVEAWLETGPDKVVKLSLSRRG